MMIDNNLDFHMVEIMNASFNDTATQVPMPPDYKMLDMTIVSSGFELGHGLGKDLDDILESLTILF